MNEVSLKPVIEELENLFSKFNARFFADKLEKPVITVSPDHTRGAYGWCTGWKAWKAGEDEGHYEINLCAEYLNRPFEETCGTLIHIRTMAYQPIFAIAGGLCTTGLLYLFAKRSGKLLPIYFLLGGIGLASLFSSFMLIMAANMDNSSYQLVARWLAGNIWGTSWHQVLALLPYMLILVPFLLTKTNILDILLLGENTAISLGIAVERELRLLLIASVALTSACVAVSGGIGFVGLVAPHIARRLIGGRHHALMPASMLLGALLLLLADTLGRSAFQPREIPVGIVISVLSAPYFLFLLRRYF